MTHEDLDALALLEREPHGYELKRYSRHTNVIDLADKRLKEWVRAQLGEPYRNTPPGFDYYACKVGRRQRQYGRTIAEAVTAAIKGAPLN